MKQIGPPEVRLFLASVNLNVKLGSQTRQSSCLSQSSAILRRFPHYIQGMQIKGKYSHWDLTTWQN